MSADGNGPYERLVKGLRKAVADPNVEVIDANIVRLLLDRFDSAQPGSDRPGASS